MATRVWYASALAVVLWIGLTCGDLLAAPTVINFDDVAGSQVVITTRYTGLGVTLNAIDNPFPLSGAYPAPAALPAILGGVTTWTEGFASATSAPQVAVAAPTQQTGQAGNGGILISFAFNVNFLSLVGNDAGGIGAGDDESVTLTAYDASGNKIGSVYSTTNMAGGFDRTPASISLSGMRYVAFNYTDSQFGFYAIDDLTFEKQTVVTPEPSTLLFLGFGLAVLRAFRRNPR